MKRNYGVDCRHCRSACTLFAIKTFVANHTQLKGDSMDPTLKDGERVMVNIIGYKIGGVEKGNVIVFHANKKMTMSNV